MGGEVPETQGAGNRDLWTRCHSEEGHEPGWAQGLVKGCPRQGIVSYLFYFLLPSLEMGTVWGAGQGISTKEGAENEPNEDRWAV